MGFLGGGLLVLLAVVLWGVVLVPGLMRGREARLSQKEAERIRRSMERLEEVKVSAESEAAVQSAREVLHREELLRQRKLEEQARQRADQAKAAAEKQMVRLQAKQAIRLSKARLRAVKLRTAPALRTARLVLAGLGALGLATALLGIGFAVAGSGFVIIVAGAAALGVALLGLVAIAPGRAAAEAATQRAAAERVNAAAAVAYEPAARVATVSDSRTERIKRAQQAAAERIAKARAEQIARSKRPAERVNLADSMLLAAPGDEPAEQEVKPRQQTAPKQVPAVTAKIGAQAATAAAAAAGQAQLKIKLRSIAMLESGQSQKVDLDAALRRRRNIG